MGGGARSVNSDAWRPPPCSSEERPPHPTAPAAPPHPVELEYNLTPRDCTVSLDLARFDRQAWLVRGEAVDASAEALDHVRKVTDFAEIQRQSASGADVSYLAGTRRVSGPNLGAAGGHPAALQPGQSIAAQPEHPARGWAARNS